MDMDMDTDTDTDRDIDMDMDMDMATDMNLSRPGGMRGAIESAALGLKPRHGMSNPNPESIKQISNLQISEPLISPPAPPHIPPGRPKTIRGLIFVIFISLGTGRAKCKKLMSPRPWCEFASKM